MEYLLPPRARVCACNGVSEFVVLSCNNHQNTLAETSSVEVLVFCDFRWCRHRPYKQLFENFNTVLDTKLEGGIK